MQPDQPGVWGRKAQLVRPVLPVLRAVQGRLVRQALQVQPDRLGAWDLQGLLERLVPPALPAAQVQLDRQDQQAPLEAQALPVP